MEKYTVLMDDKIQHSYYVNSAQIDLSIGNSASQNSQQACL